MVAFAPGHTRTPIAPTAPNLNPLDKASDTLKAGADLLRELKGAHSLDDIKGAVTKFLDCLKSLHGDDLHRPLHSHSRSAHSHGPDFGALTLFFDIYKKGLELAWGSHSCNANKDILMRLLFAALDPHCSPAHNVIKPGSPDVRPWQK